MLDVAELPRISSGRISDHPLVNGLFSDAPLPATKRKSGINLAAALTLLWWVLTQTRFWRMSMIFLIRHVGPFHNRRFRWRRFFGGLADLFAQPDTNRHARFTGRNLSDLSVFCRDAFYTPGGFT
ncbi:MAG: hypothetical protein ABJ201_17655 [Nisaea sp.]